MDMVFTRVETPEGEAAWFVTTELSQIVPSTTHPSTETEAFSDIFLKNGLRIVAKGSPDDIFTMIAQPEGSEGSGADA